MAVLPELLVRQELDCGELVMPFRHEVQSTHAYHLVYPEEKRDLPTVRAFRDWLLAEVDSI